MFLHKQVKQIALLVVVLASASLASAQTQTIAKKGSLIGATYKGSEDPASLAGWKHTEGVPVPKSKSKVAAYGVDYYQKGSQHMFLLLQKVSGARAAKDITWKVLDTLYISQVERGKFLEFCAACKNASKPSNEVFITINNNPTKEDTKKGYYSISQIWQADRTVGKFIVPTSFGIKSYMDTGK